MRLRLKRKVGLRLVRDGHGIAFVLPAVGGGTELVYLFEFDEGEAEAREDEGEDEAHPPEA